MLSAATFSLLHACATSFAPTLIDCYHLVSSLARRFASFSRPAIHAASFRFSPASASSIDFCRLSTRMARRRCNRRTAPWAQLRQRFFTILFFSIDIARSCYFATYDTSRFLSTSHLLSRLFIGFWHTESRRSLEGRDIAAWPPSLLASYFRSSLPPSPRLIIFLYIITGRRAHAIPPADDIAVEH